VELLDPFVLVNLFCGMTGQIAFDVSSCMPFYSSPTVLCCAVLCCTVHTSSTLHSSSQTSQLPLLLVRDARARVFGRSVRCKTNEKSSVPSFNLYAFY
jgi:hypothetical protein